MINEPPDSRYGPPPSGSTKETTSLLEAGPMLPVPVATAQVARLAEEQNQPARAIDEQLMHRIEKLPREAGWALVTAGVIGLIAPGVVGFPFVVAGAVVLSPGGPRKLARWRSRKPRQSARAGIGQVCALVGYVGR